MTSNLTMGKLEILVILDIALSRFMDKWGIAIMGKNYHGHTEYRYNEYDISIQITMDK